MGFGYPRRWLGFCMMGMWSWSMIKVVCGLSIIDAPWTPSPLVSPVSSLHHHPHRFPQLTSLQKFLRTPLLMVHWVMVNLGTESGKVIMKVARMAHTGHVQGRHSPGVSIACVCVWGGCNTAQSPRRTGRRRQPRAEWMRSGTKGPGDNLRGQTLLWLNPADEFSGRPRRADPEKTNFTLSKISSRVTPGPSRGP